MIMSIIVINYFLSRKCWSIRGHIILGPCQVESADQRLRGRVCQALVWRHSVGRMSLYPLVISPNLKYVFQQNEAIETNTLVSARTGSRSGHNEACSDHNVGVQRGNIRQ
jgi:hypothetical protein